MIQKTFNSTLIFDVDETLTIEEAFFIIETVKCNTTFFTNYKKKIIGMTKKVVLYSSLTSLAVVTLTNRVHYCETLNRTMSSQACFAALNAPGSSRPTSRTSRQPVLQASRTTSNEASTSNPSSAARQVAEGLETTHRQMTGESESAASQTGVVSRWKNRGAALAHDGAAALAPDGAAALAHDVGAALTHAAVAHAAGAHAAGAQTQGLRQSVAYGAAHALVERLTNWVVNSTEQLKLKHRENRELQQRKDAPVMYIVDETQLEPPQFPLQNPDTTEDQLVTLNMASDYYPNFEFDQKNHTLLIKNLEFDRETDSYVINDDLTRAKLFGPKIGKLTTVAPFNNVFRRAENNYGIQIPLMEFKSFVENIQMEPVKLKKIVSEVYPPAAFPLQTSEYATRGAFRILVNPISIPQGSILPQIPSEICYNLTLVQDLVKKVLEVQPDIEFFKTNEINLAMLIDKNRPKPVKREFQQNDLNVLRKLQQSYRNKSILLYNLDNLLCKMDPIRYNLKSKNYPHRVDTNSDQSYFNYFQRMNILDIPLYHNSRIEMEFENLVKIELVSPGTLYDIARGYEEYSTRLKQALSNNGQLLKDSFEDRNKENAAKLLQKQDSAKIFQENFNIEEHEAWELFNKKNAIANQVFNSTSELKNIRTEIANYHSQLKDWGQSQIKLEIKNINTACQTEENVALSSQALHRIEKISKSFSNSIKLLKIVNNVPELLKKQASSLESISKIKIQENSSPETYKTVLTRLKTSIDELNKEYCRTLQKQKLPIKIKAPTFEDLETLFESQPVSEINEALKNKHKEVTQFHKALSSQTVKQTYALCNKIKKDWMEQLK